MILCRAWFFLLEAALFACICGGCHESSVAQPSLVAKPHGSVEKPRVVPSAAAGVGSPVAGAGAGGAIDAGAAPPASASATPEVEGNLAIIDADGNALDQTEERPTLSSASFQKRLAVLAAAIISGDVEPATLAFFPLAAYQKVKDVAKPERDYKFRLLAHFKRDLLEYHRALGPLATTARFEGITVPEREAKWMKPGSEGNRVGYFRVLRSSLRFVLPTGRTRDLELTSLISWRGQWYVVHLHGFQ